MSTFVSSIPRY